MNKKFKTFMTYNWIWYILALIVPLFGYYYVYEVISTPGYDQSIYFFIGTNFIEKRELEESLYLGFENTTIKQVSVDNSSPDDFYFPTVFNTRGMVNTDIIILNDEYLVEGVYNTYFAPLKLDVIASYLGDVSKYEFYTDSDNIKYGIKVNTFMDEYISYKEKTNYYMFFNKNSNKLGDLSLEIAKNDYALYAMKHFITRG